MFTTSGDSLDQAILNLKGKLNSPDLVTQMGQSLSEQLKESFTASGLISRSSATLEALSYVGEPQRISNGWTIGVGNRDDLGAEDEPAPRGVLREFFNDNPELRPSPWRGIPESYQEKLASLRRAGMYGGRGPTYANYMWVQDKGSAEAYISGRHFIESGLAMWRSIAPDIISSWWESIGTAGRIRRTILGVFGR